MMTRLSSIAVLLLVTVAVGDAVAQPDITAAPTYGTYSLDRGFQPTPASYAVTAGGEYNSSEMLVDGQPCSAGFISVPPDVRIHYSAGSGPLVFYVDTPGSDPTLAINDPTGTWFCTDDWNSLMPRLDFAEPLSGQYDVFVGTFREGEFPSVQLYVSEDPEATPQN